MTIDKYEKLTFEVGNMIKLIATDMDGTLLNGNGQLPENFFSTLKQLEAKNVNFVVASGRPYSTLYENFKPYSDQLQFICDNGAYIVEPGKEPIITTIDRTLAKEVLKVCETIPDIELIICAVNHTYIKPSSAEFEQEIEKYYINKKVVPDFSDIDDDIFKIAICDHKGAKENSYEILHAIFKDQCKIAVSGTLWADINSKEVNKGSSLKKLQQDLNITYDETMVFGDFYNDVEMLQAAHYSFVMENANEDMKQYGNFTAKRNTENGVIQAIEKYVLTSENQ